MDHQPDRNRELLRHVHHPLDFFFKVLLLLAVVATVWVLFLTAQLWLVLFASTLAAVGLGMLARWLARWLHLPRSLAYVAILLTTAGLLAVGVWAAWPVLQREGTAILDDLPRMVEQFKISWLGRQFMDQGNDAAPIEMLQSVGAPMMGAATTFLSIFTLVGLGIVLVLFLGYNPSAYRDRIVRAVPPRNRPAAYEYFEVLARALERWLLGQVVAMLAIATMMTLALHLLGVSYPWTLGLLAGLCQFIPYLGPVLWVIPATFIAGSSSWTEGAIVVALYGAVQAFEGNFLTPMIQQKAVELPPVTTIFGTMIFGLVFGPIGFMLATPLLVVVMVTYSHFWLRRIEQDAPPPERPARG